MAKSNKILIVILGIVIAGSIALGIFGFIRGLQKSKIAADTLPADIAEHINSKKDLIVVDEPKPLAVISSPLIVRGRARGIWFFEASFPIVLTDWDGRIIAEWYATAKDEWMTENFVPFEGTLEFKNPSFPGVDADHFSRRGYLIFKKDNPSGLPEHDDALEIPILFGR